MWVILRLMPDGNICISNTGLPMTLEMALVVIESCKTMRDLWHNRYFPVPVHELPLFGLAPDHSGVI